LKLLPLILASVAFSSSAATIYRCEGPDGVIEFSDWVCGGSGGSTVELHPENKRKRPPEPPRSRGEDRAAPSKYVRPLELGPDLHNNFQRVRAVIDVGGIKARDCDWDINVSGRMSRCEDFMSYLTDGSE